MVLVFYVFLWEQMGIYGKIYGNSTLGGGNMAKSKEKLEEIKIRLTPEEKKLIKNASLR